MTSHVASLVAIESTRIVFSMSVCRITLRCQAMRGRLLCACEVHLLLGTDIALRSMGIYDSSSNSLLVERFELLHVILVKLHQRQELATQLLLRLHLHGQPVGAVLRRKDTTTMTVFDKLFFYGGRIAVEARQAQNILSLRELSLSGIFRIIGYTFEDKAVVH